ncbi:hypothetical protein IFM89_029253, partial [Coptis chinensis]
MADPVRSMFKSFNLIDDMIKIRNDVLIKKPTPSSFEIQIAWTPPCQHWVKLNTDGSALGAPGPAGYGCVFRGEDGNFLFGVALPIPVADAMVVEFFVVWIELKAALCLKFRKIIIETDSKYVHQVILERETRVSKAIKSLVHDIRDMLMMIDEYMILWNYREVNFVADAFAKWATNLAANQQWWANPIIHRDDDPLYSHNKVPIDSLRTSQNSNASSEEHYIDQIEHFNTNMPKVKPFVPKRKKPNVDVGCSINEIEYPLDALPVTPQSITKPKAKPYVSKRKKQNVDVGSSINEIEHPPYAPLVTPQSITKPNAKPYVSKGKKKLSFD